MRSVHKTCVQKKKMAYPKTYNIARPMATTIEATLTYSCRAATLWFVLFLIKKPTIKPKWSKAVGPIIHQPNIALA